jgi:hypothetical protein
MVNELSPPRLIILPCFGEIMIMDKTSSSDDGIDKPLKQV